jgi:hypothetical protein
VAGATELAIGQASWNDQHRTKKGEDGTESPEGHPQVVERLGVLPVDEAPSAAAELPAGFGNRGVGGGSRRGWCRRLSRRGRLGRLDRPIRALDWFGGCSHVTIIPRKRHDATSIRPVA